MPSARGGLRDEFAIQGVERGGHFARGGDGAGGEIRLGQRRAEERHDGVADVFVDHAVVFFNDGAHAVEVTVEQREQFGRRQFFTQRGDVAQVGKEDGGFAHSAAKLQIRPEHLRGDFGQDHLAEQVPHAIAFGEAGTERVARTTTGNVARRTTGARTRRWPAGRGRSGGAWAD
ncbi:MAG: hypothetical protein Q8J74_11325 [Candidatus Didemnitutus sp.]|nr:hypothetical protein [Candidatus Didemnitutus sp.]